MGKKRQRGGGGAIVAGSGAALDPEELAAMEEEDEFEKELAAAREIEREQRLVKALMGGQLEGSDEDGEEEGSGGAPGGIKPRECVNNVKGLRQALAEIEAQNGPRPWPETMEICEFPLGLDDVHDDIKRETAFYQVALKAVKAGRAKLLQHGVRYKRPEDFFCDMLKSDEHMAKVKDRLLFEQKKIAAVEERRRQQESRKFAKAVKSHKAKEKTEDKKRTLEAVKEWQKKSKAQRGGQGLLPDRDEGLEDILDGKGGAASSSSPGGRGGGKGGANKRRMAKDRKYGFGGPKRKLKQADGKSLNDFSSFNPKKGKTFGGPKGKGGGKGKKGGNRPGKTARAKARQRK